MVKIYWQRSRFFSFKQNLNIDAFKPTVDLFSFKYVAKSLKSHKEKVISKMLTITVNGKS